MDISKIEECMYSEILKRENTMSPKIEEAIKEFSKSGIFILGGLNQYVVLQWWKTLTDGQCTTAKMWFWTQWGSCQTPTWIHKIWEYVWLWIDARMSINLRKPTGKIVDLNCSPAIVWRLATLEWMEKHNRNTDFRDVYLHGTPNTRFWDHENLKQSFGCIGLRPEEAVKVMDILSQSPSSFIYITPTSHI